MGGNVIVCGIASMQLLIFAGEPDNIILYSTKTGINANPRYIISS